MSSWENESWIFKRSLPPSMPGWWNNAKRSILLSFKHFVKAWLWINNTADQWEQREKEREKGKSSRVVYNVQYAHWSVFTQQVLKGFRSRSKHHEVLALTVLKELKDVCHGVVCVSVITTIPSNVKHHLSCSFHFVFVFRSPCAWAFTNETDSDWQAGSLQRINDLITTINTSAGPPFLVRKVAGSFACLCS